MTGPPRNLTFADAAEKVMNDDSGLSRVFTIDRDKIPAERLHLKVANRRCRPMSDSRIVEAPFTKPTYVPRREAQGLAKLRSRARGTQAVEALEALQWGFAFGVQRLARYRLSRHANARQAACYCGQAAFWSRSGSSELTNNSGDVR